jgi:hypothetical protein
MEDLSVQADGLRRLLEGNRFRVASRSWVVVRTRIVGMTVLIELEASSRSRPVSVELPNGFDVCEPEHVGWLFYNVERALQE